MGTSSKGPKKDDKRKVPVKDLKVKGAAAVKGGLNPQPLPPGYAARSEPPDPC